MRIVILKKALASCLGFFILAMSSISAQTGKWAFTYTPSMVEAPNLQYTIQPGIAYNINQNLQLLTEAAFKGGAPNDPTISQIKYFRLKSEFRILLTRNNSIVKGYTGAQISFANRSWNRSSQGKYFESDQKRDSAISYTSTKINSPIGTITAQLGAVAHLGKHFALDVFMGMGARAVFTNYSQIENSTKVINEVAKCRIIIKPDPAWWVNGTVARFQLNTGTRLLFTF